MLLAFSGKGLKLLKNSCLDMPIKDLFTRYDLPWNCEAVGLSCEKCGHYIHGVKSPRYSACKCHNFSLELIEAKIKKGEWFCKEFEGKGTFPALKEFKKIRNKLKADILYGIVEGSYLKEIPFSRFKLNHPLRKFIDSLKRKDDIDKIWKDLQSKYKRLKKNPLTDYSVTVAVRFKHKYDGYENFEKAVNCLKRKVKGCTKEDYEKILRKAIKLYDDASELMIKARKSGVDLDRLRITLKEKNKDFYESDYVNALFNAWYWCVLR